MAKKVTPIPKPRNARHYLREWRKYRNLTQERLAERIDATPSTISQLENGQISYTQPTLEALAVALNCEPGDILSRDPAIDDAIDDMRRLLRTASSADQKLALRVIREMLGKNSTAG